MKFFMQKGFTQKLIIAIVSITLLNFCFTPNVHAETPGAFGGEMMSLIRWFATGLADAAAAIVQRAVTGKWNPAVDVEGSGMLERKRRKDRLLDRKRL